MILFPAGEVVLRVPHPMRWIPHSSCDVEFYYVILRHRCEPVWANLSTGCVSSMYGSLGARGSQTRSKQMVWQNALPTMWLSLAIEA